MERCELNRVVTTKRMKTMKNIWKSLFVAALFVSCSEQVAEETVAPEVNNGKAIQFEVANVGGRAAYFQGEGHDVVLEGDEQLSIRHFIGESVEDCKAYAEDKTIFPETATAEKNAWLNANVQRGNYKMEDGVWTFQGGTNYQDITWVNGIENTICAFILPASVKSDNRYANGIKRATLSGDQVQAAANNHSHLSDYMIMMADPQKFAAGNQPEKVSIQLQNVLSIVEVTLKSEVAKTVKSLSLASKATPLAVSGGTVVMDATKKVSTGVSPFVIDEGKGVNEVKLTLTEAAEVTAEGAKFYFVVLPGAHAAKDIVLTATGVDGKNYQMEMGAIEFKMNKVYRPVVALDEMKLVSETLHFDFTSEPTEEDGVTKWGYGTSVNNCKLKIYKEVEPEGKTFYMPGVSGLLFTFSQIEDTWSTTKNDYFGTTYRIESKNGISSLIMLQGNTGTTTQTIGLPVREGYKLVRVQGYCDVKGQKFAGTYVAITSDAGGVTVKQDSMNTSGTHEYADVVTNDSTVVSEFEGMTTEKVIKIAASQEEPWTFTIPTAQKNTRYYLSASGPYLTIAHLYLTYERVE